MVYKYIVKKQKRKHIELFAGCGGMSLGMEAAGFDLEFANELSPMAAQTFAFNILGEDLEAKTKAGKTLWINSKYESDEIDNRLRENPLDKLNRNFSDIGDKSSLKGNLLVGDINDFLEIVRNNKSLSSYLKNLDVDLISGGPPCQSFSLAGKRIKDDHKNTLPLSFAKFVGLINPKVVLLENVKGIISPFTENGEKHYAWIEVAKAFAVEGYIPICMMVNSKYFGVAQNRPRFILLAYREDVFNRLETNDKELVLNESLKFYRKARKNQKSLESISVKDLTCYDIESKPEYFNGDLFPKISHREGQFVSASEAIGDIRRTNRDYEYSQITKGYGQLLNKTFKRKIEDNYWIQNHIPRSHRYDVKARFRFYQVLNEFQNGLRKSAVDLFTGKNVDTEKMDLLFKEFSEYNLYFKKGNQEFYQKPNSIKEVERLVKQIPSKKHSQRALKEYDPAPAQLTIPDDLCHYHMESLRTMTVREMARFQSFPDWFEFKSKVTTGGKMRKFEVPQYTQVGNAVPPLLALVLGKLVDKQLKNIDRHGKI